MNIPKTPSRAELRASLLFYHCRRATDPSQCRLTYEGPMPANGVPRVAYLFGRAEAWQRAVYRHFTGARLLRDDRVVAVCGSEVCGDKRHLRVIPSKPSKPPKAPRTPRLKASDKGTVSGTTPDSASS